MARWVLYMMVLTIPIEGLPKAYPLPGTLKNVGGACLLLLLALSLVKFWRERGTYEKCPRWLKGYLALVSLWPLLCTAVGAVTFPYWDEASNAFLRETGMVQKIAIFYPAILTNETLLHLKYGFSMMTGVVKTLLIPLLGMYFSLYVMFRGKDSRYILDTVSRAAVVATLGFCAYSLIEIPWILTGNEWCANVLKWINVHLYDIKTNHGWWPPLLWPDPQLRSFAREPSYFGIEATFLVPLLWYRAAVLREKKICLLLVLFCYMIFLTHARTAQLIFLGELALLVAFSLWGRYPSWGKALGIVLLTSSLSFGTYLYVPTLISSVRSVTQVSSAHPKKDAGAGKDKQKKSNIAQQKKKAVAPKSAAQALNAYKQDVGSLTDVSKRSNTARLGNTVAVFTVGLKNPILGVGKGFESSYMVDNFPDFAKSNGEVKLWISTMRNKGFVDGGLPLLNMFGAVICGYGIPGLLLFLTPLGMIGFHFLKNRRKLLQSGGMVCMLIALGGQVACLFSNSMFYTYPLALAATLLLMRQILKEEEI